MPAMGPVEFWHWWVLGGALVILETFAPGFVFLWLGVAAGVVGSVLIVWPGAALEFQLLAFAGLSLASVLGWRRWQSSRPDRSDQPNLNRRAARYVGRRFSLVEPIINGRGRIRLADATWSVTGPDLPAGRVVEVIAADGAVLTVARVADTAAGRPAETSA
jgi:membrane protein implicated in regulation of membrane protease activity